MHLFNPVDLCLLDHLDDLIKAGIKLIRIEAKGRDPQWIRTVAAAYAAKLDGKTVTKQDLPAAAGTDIFTKGHFHRGVK